ncbi:hypothetical protein NHX12_021017 [Muraenolepis orangiensis]|uniref:Transcription factor IIIA n=1 Tax=Muraenolepis orangiensis TaxID=630683 RepID=A0A9Q0EPU0_9TELE|nr:hypothetical protein NHX12_021017 [Muraenolepis orangiensis]
MGERLQSTKPFICSFFDCKASFVKSWKLEAHLCEHTGLKPFPCLDCDRNFCTGYQLNRHQRTHSGDKPYACKADGCVEAFATPSSMKNHMVKTHQNQGKLYKCDQPSCGKDFNKKYLLRAHAYEHTKVLPFQCTFTNCTKEFPSRATLKKHDKIHKGYPCDVDGCPFQGNFWSEYLTHRKEHKVKSQCDKCQKQFNNGRFLHLHDLHVHLGVKKALLCPHECGKTFTRQFHRESHVLSEHDGTKAFSCGSPNCSKAFAMKESLWRHSVVHDPKRTKMTKLQSKTNKPSVKPATSAEKQTPASGKPTTDARRLAAKLARTKLSDS